MVGFRKQADDDAIGRGRGAVRDISHLTKAGLTLTEEGHPVVYRSSRLKTVANRPYLFSPFFDVRWERGPMEARCQNRKHAAPSTGCGCGVYGLFNEDDVKEWQPSEGGTAIITQHRVWGNIVAPDKPVGLRAQYSQIIGIRMPPCYYCDLEGKKRSADWMTKDWTACDEHRKYWDDLIEKEEGKGALPKWKDARKLMRQVASYYGADLYEYGEPMRYQPGYEKRD